VPPQHELEEETGTWTIQERFIETWTHAGIDCAIGHTSLQGRCFNGYARLPDNHPLRRIVDAHATLRPDDPAWRVLENVIEESDWGLSVHGGLNYGPDDEGWIGFDTAHAGDLWRAEDFLPHMTDKQRAVFEYMRDNLVGPYPVLRDWYDEHHPVESFWVERPRLWTLERLRKEVNSLADQLADQIAEVARMVAEDH